MKNKRKSLLYYCSSSFVHFPVSFLQWVLTPCRVGAALSVAEMKNAQNLTARSIPLVILLLLVTMPACKKWTEVEPQGVLVEGVEVDEAVMDNLITAAYSGLTSRFINLHHVTFQGPTSNWIADVRSDDAYKGGGGIVDQVPIHQAETYTLNANNDIAFNKWLNLTWAIARCNNAIRTLAAYNNDKYPKEIRRGELLFLRAHFMLDFVRNFKNVPWLDENVLATDATNTAFTYEELLEKIAESLRTAYDILPIDQDLQARVNKINAAAYLCKVYIEQKNWTDAITMADVVINSQKYSLLDEFEDLAKLPEENGKEMVFTIQFAKTENIDFGHNIGNILNVTYSNVYPGGDDFYLGSQNLINAFKTDDNGLPLFDTFNEGTDITTNAYADPVDPRLDFTFGRPGVPWKETGVYSYPEWRRSLDYPLNYSSKKHIIDASDPNLHDGLPWAASGLNFALIRYAEVLLWKAEALIESNTNLEEARNLINEVRERAKNSTYVRTPDGSATAANYNIGLYESAGWTQDYARKAIRMERRLELAMEGHRIFDLNRWGITAATINKYLEAEAAKTPYLQGVFFMENVHEYLPIPQVEIDKAPSLYQQNNGY
jgi:starch-binding outer membrane protein, SusD/RagB family